jgi:hypothetical protein
LAKTKEASQNYDYTAAERVDRKRKTLAEAGGARVEAYLNADEVAKLDALAHASFNKSRQATLRYLVQQLPGPKKKS